MEPIALVAGPRQHGALCSTGECREWVESGVRVTWELRGCGFDVDGLWGGMGNDRAAQAIGYVAGEQWSWRMREGSMRTATDRSFAVGFRMPIGSFDLGVERLAETVRRLEELEVDHLCVGDHVAFHDGTGYDGLIQSTALALLSSGMRIFTSVYVLPLRHPVLVARQILSFCQLAPARLTFGVGIGGEDRKEAQSCGVNPNIRGRRMNESLAILRPLLAGETVSFDGEFFQISEVSLRPVPEVPVPIIIGGRSAAAIQRTATFGDGWLGIWVSPTRFAAVTVEIEERAAIAGRSVGRWQHGYTAWCGFGASVEVATVGLADDMEALYRVPFSSFDRYCPRGRPEDVAEALFPYIEAGASVINLIPAGKDVNESAEGVAEVRRILNLWTTRRDA